MKLKLLVYPCNTALLYRRSWTDVGPCDRGAGAGANRGRTDRRGPRRWSAWDIRSIFFSTVQKAGILLDAAERADYLYSRAGSHTNRILICSCIMPVLSRPRRGAASERTSLTSSSSSRLLLSQGRLCQRRGALFLITLLSKLAIVGVLPALGPE